MQAGGGSVDSVVGRARSVARAAVAAGVAGILVAGASPAWTSEARAASPHPPPAPPAPPARLALSSDLWATVDVCNTPAHPRILGIRASMPGTGHRRERLAMRFQAQFQQADGTWADLPAASSGFRVLGSAGFKVRESGWNFNFLPTPGGQRSMLRGLVVFQWRRHNGHVRYQTQLATTAGHPTGAQGDPPNYSADICALS
ncbi:MAG TPA: hypothetical protein VGY97_10195 [Solirubrobacteraceae bacterium]|jgi:hypothetical protein|nr:hypothetical protein [Solirubrobacteraceae bacterium]